MKKILLKGVIGILTVMFYDTAVVANASEKQENILDLYAYTEDTSDDTAIGWQLLRDCKIHGQREDTSDDTVIGWQEVEGGRYYFTPETGAAATGWQEIEGGRYYFTPETGEMTTGWREIEGGKYYFSPETGAMSAGLQEIEGERYYFSLETGVMTTGWQELEGERYYFSPETGAMTTGWQEIQGERYYFTPETGAMATGLQELEGGRYYFSPETGAMSTGWQELEGEKYYFLADSGKMVQGRQEIGNKAYFFGESGTLCTSGWAGSGQKTYYCGANGALVSGWKKIKGNRYYFLPKNNRMVVGFREIEGSYYIFHDNGKLARSGGITIVAAGDKIYCAGADGKAAGGWQIKNEKLYYANKKGIAKRNTTYQGILFTKTGAAADNVESRLKIQLIQTVASITNEKMSKQTKLASCWSYITGGKFRYAGKYPNLNKSGWQRETALDMLSTYTGNCYSYACAFAALASEIGYKPNVICGRVRGSRDGVTDGYTRHAWVMIDGKHYDPEAHYAGWMRNVYARSSYPTSNQIQRIVAFND